MTISCVANGTHTPIDGRETLALGFVVKALEVGLAWGAFMTGCHINEARVSHTRAHGDDRGSWIGYQVLQCVGLFRYPGGGSCQMM